MDTAAGGVTGTFVQRQNAMARKMRAITKNENDVIAHIVEMSSPT